MEFSKVISNVLIIFKSLRDHKIGVTNAFVLLDREQGAVENVANIGVKITRYIDGYKLFFNKSYFHVEKLKSIFKY